MLGSQINLTEGEIRALQSIAEQTGRDEQELLSEAIADLIARYEHARSLDLLRSARGIWKNRADLPDAELLRAEWERSAGAGGK